MDSSLSAIFILAAVIGSNFAQETHFNVSQSHDRQKRSECQVINGSCVCLPGFQDVFNTTTELVFVVDGSASIGTFNFAFVRSWLVNATEVLIARYKGFLRTQILQYSDREPVWTGVSIEDTDVFEIPYTLNEDLTLEEIEERIMNMPYLEKNTYTYYALRRVMEVEFSRSNHYNESIKVIVVLTDGEASDALLLDHWYERYKNTVTPIAIGVKVTNGTPFYTQLQKIANGGASDERVLNVDDFSTLGTLTNNLVSLIDGTVGYGSNCEDINECESSALPFCGENSICQNTYGSAECVCVNGFQLATDNKTCEDIDECATVVCAENSNCVNNVGSYECVCQAGYTASGNMTCEDIDECTSSSDNNCHAYASCKNFDPGFRCSCNEGYRDKNSANSGTDCEPQCELDGEPYCQNGGSCTNATDNADPTCGCTTFFTGVRCQEINGGVIAAIVVAVTLVCVIILIVIFICRKK